VHWPGPPGHTAETVTVFEEMGHITRSAAKPLAAKPLGPEAQGRAVPRTPGQCTVWGMVAGAGTGAGRDGLGLEAPPGPAVGGSPGLSQTLQRRTARGRRTLWPVGLWSGWTQPAGARERSCEVTWTTREASVTEEGAHQAWTSWPRSNGTKRQTRRREFTVGWDGAARNGRHAGVE
jgi:hypothetical protein